MIGADQGDHLSIDDLQLNIWMIEFWCLAFFRIEFPEVCFCHRTNGCLPKGKNDMKLPKKMKKKGSVAFEEEKEEKKHDNTYDRKLSRAVYNSIMAHYGQLK